MKTLLSFSVFGTSLRNKQQSLLHVVSLFIVTLFSSISLSSCQYYNLDNHRVPDASEAIILFRFFAYVNNDPPPLSIHKIPLGLSPPKTPRLPEKLRRMLEEKKDEESNEDLRNSEGDENTRDVSERSTEIFLYNVGLETKNETVFSINSVQLSVIRYDDFRSRFLEEAPQGPPSLCCHMKDFNAGLCKEVNTIIIPEDAQYFKSITIKDKSETKQTVGLKVPSSDMYILLLSNCGTVENGSIVLSGSAYLHNYFGYLPGIDAPKPTLYILLSAFYVFLLVIFGIRAARYRTQLIHIHWAIGAVVIVCLLEALIWFSFYRHRNMYPEPRTLFFSLAIITTVVRNIFAFMLVLVASLGWGITKPQLATSTKRKIYLVVISYVIFDSSRQIMTQMRLSHELSIFVVLSCVLPVALLHGVIFFWIFSSLTEVIDELKSKRQEIKLALFLRFWMVLVFTIIGAAVFLCSEVYIMFRERSSNWKNEWIFTDLAPHIVFVLVLNTMIVLWAPSRNSKSMAYSSELPDEELAGHSSRDLEPNNVMGREALDPTEDAMGRLSSDGDRRNIEMTSGVAEAKNFKLWGKSQQHQPLEDLDYDDET